MNERRDDWAQAFGESVSIAAILTHDLGEYPEYPRANVLTSTDFRYFGVNGTDEYKSKYELVRKAVEKALGAGSVSILPQSCELFLAMKKWLWGKNEIKVLGRPTDEPSGSSCYRSRFCGVV